MKKQTLSAGIVPVFRGDADEILFLLLRSYRYWDFPKGLVEDGEEALAAAIRELTEETGLERVDFPFEQLFTETEPYAQNKIARYYVGEVFSKEINLGVNPELGHAEHQEFRWVTAEQARKLLGERVTQVLNWADAIVKEGRLIDK